MDIQRNVNAVAITPDGIKVVSGSNDKTIKIWDLQSGVLLRSLDNKDAVYTTAVTPDGKQVFSSSGDNSLRYGIWNPANPKHCFKLTAQSSVSHLMVIGWPAVMNKDMSGFLNGSNNTF